MRQFLQSVNPWKSRVAGSCLDLWAVKGPLGCADNYLDLWAVQGLLGWGLKADADFSVALAAQI